MSTHARLVERNIMRHFLPSGHPILHLHQISNARKTPCWGGYGLDVLDATGCEGDMVISRTTPNIECPQNSLLGGIWTRCVRCNVM